MKILLFGSNGQVGWELRRSLQLLGEVVALGRDDADFSKPECLGAVIQNINPDVIVNAAAYTSVDKAEQNEGLAEKINGFAPKVIADEAVKTNALLIHYSTDYVFDGEQISPYVEADAPGPVNVYGRTKLDGEMAIERSGCDYLIFRTSWVYSSRGSNFLNTIIKLAKERDELSVVSDQYGAPTWARNIADATALALIVVRQEREICKFESGVYHLCARGKTTWQGFSKAIIERLKQQSNPVSIITKSVLPIATEDYPLPAQRPTNSQLDTSAFMARFKLAMPEWQNAMNLCIDEILDVS